ncbi:MAG TPA: hypothetical protein PKM73_14860 [Verrucomicrobiota bacterium]|nr:hypothetical protein [Verrucomicrobiota bacterium]HNU52903.1 hypothetical protein [Verrucomicrobiota bacterium]
MAQKPPGKVPACDPQWLASPGVLDHGAVIGQHLESRPGRHGRRLTRKSRGDPIPAAH